MELITRTVLELTGEEINSLNRTRDILAELLDVMGDVRCISLEGDDFCIEDHEIDTMVELLTQILEASE